MASEEAIRGLREGAEIVGAAGARLALEFYPFGVIPTLADAIPLCEAVGWERCGLLVDTWHFFYGGEPWDLFRSLDATQIALVHADDAPPMESADLLDETVERRVPLGAGSFDLEGFAGVLDEIGYEGAYSLEVLSGVLRRQAPATVARTLMESAREHWPLQRNLAAPTD
jgi:sugar phosphate isomerase/epimerase